MDPIMKTRAPPSQMHPLAWISKMYAFWSGSLKYKFVYSNTDSEVFVAYMPQECARFKMYSGVSPLDVQQSMCYAGDIAVSHLQGSLEVTVPFSSPYNQCLVNPRNGHFDLRNQNGTLFFYMRNKFVTGDSVEPYPK